ncbi:MAG: hypothetical protein HOU81_09380 [Hamadaea sp.]|uniref:hypothetical protein n=1 Tax=Hamadaea sp. TaxID=2024425 RepID=UPI001804C3A7|nr:hypothetical protein [Hamadaea sp.]NUR71021.1 hypothetical protein [Hamadaea sp.]NUT23702.1 hypothetical protein [Hamadaea sp.]
MIDELQRTLRERAEVVVARPQPYERLLRRRRVRRRTTAMTAAAVAILIAVPLGFKAIVLPTYDPEPGPPPAAVAPLLNSPTRGSLAGDEKFLAGLRERAAAVANVGRGPNGPHMPSDPDLIKVLFAGDVGTRRIAIVAGLDGWPLEALFQGSVGDDPGDLYNSGSGELEPVVHTDTAKMGSDRSETYLLLGPAGASIDKATSVYSSTGVRRTWTPVAADQGYVAYPDLTWRERLRVRMGDMVIWEGVGGRAPDAAVEVDPQPVLGHGTAIPASYAQMAANYLAYSTGLSGPGAKYRVLWSDRLTMPGTKQGEAYAVVVQAITADGGGPYSLYVFEAGTEDTRNLPIGNGTAGPPDQAFLLLRLPSFAAMTDDRVYAVAPPAAARAEFTDASGHTVGIGLSNGVGWLNTPAGIDSEVRFYDGGGALLATRQFSDKDRGASCDEHDPSICDGPISVRESRPAEPVR